MLMEMVPREVGPSSPAVAAKGIIATTVTMSTRAGFTNLLKSNLAVKNTVFEPTRFTPYKICSKLEQIGRMGVAVKHSEPGRPAPELQAMRRG